MHELSSLSSSSREHPSCDSENEQSRLKKTRESRFSLNDKKTKFSLILEQRFTNTSSKPNLIGEVSRN